jgi:hypothetical protein
MALIVRRKLRLRVEAILKGGWGVINSIVFGEWQSMNGEYADVLD